MAKVYRSRKGLSFELSGGFVLVYEVDEKKDDGSWSAQPVGIQHPAIDYHFVAL